VFSLFVLIFSVFIGRIFHLSPAITLEARHALYVIALWSVARVPLTAYGTAMIATQDIAAANMISALGSILRTLASLGYVLAGGGLFGLMLAGTTAEAISLILYRVRFRKNNPGLMPGWGIPDKKLLREMLGFGGHAAILNVGNMLAFGTGNSVAGITSGAAAASSFYTSQMPSMMASNLLGRLSESAQPALNELFGSGNFERVRTSFSRITRLQLLFGFPLAAGILLFNRDLISAWVGPKQYAGVLLTVALGIYCMVSGLQGIAIRFSYVFGWMRLLAVTSILQGFANFGLGLYLGRTLGLGGISLALLIVVMPQLFILLRRIGNALRLNVVTLLVGCTLKAVIPLAAAFAVGLLAHRFVQIRVHHFGGFLAETVPFIFVYFSLAYFIYLTDQDRNDANRFFAGAVDRGRGVGIRLSRLLSVR
jgi:O-antigen/teichoic acid export membrane protein